MAETIKLHPTRFVGLGTLPMQAPNLAVDELRRCKEELGKWCNLLPKSVSLFALNVNFTKAALVKKYSVCH